MDFLTTSLKEFLTINYDKETISKEDFLIFLNKQGILFKSPENNEQGSKFLFGDNISNYEKNIARKKKRLDAEFEKNTIPQPIFKNDIEISNSIEKLLEGLSARKAKEILQTTLDCIDDSSIVKSQIS